MSEGRVYRGIALRPNSIYMLYILGIITGLLIAIVLLLMERKVDHRLTEKIAEAIEPNAQAVIIKEPVTPNDQLINILNHGQPRQRESDDSGDY